MVLCVKCYKTWCKSQSDITVCMCVLFPIVFVLFCVHAWFFFCMHNTFSMGPFPVMMMMRLSLKTRSPKAMMLLSKKWNIPKSNNKSGQDVMSLNMCALNKEYFNQCSFIFTFFLYHSWCTWTPHSQRAKQFLHIHVGFLGREELFW